MPAGADDPLDRNGRAMAAGPEVIAPEAPLEALEAGILRGPRMEGEMAGETAEARPGEMLPLLPGLAPVGRQWVQLHFDNSVNVIIELLDTKASR